MILLLKSCDILATALGLLIGLTAPAAAEGTQPVTKDMEVADVTEVHPVSSFMQGEQPAISARSVQYDEKTGRYICHGSVQIHLGDRLITAAEAQITRDLSAIWTQGTARLIDREIGVFDGHVLYIDSDGEKAFVHLEYDFNKNKIA